MEAGIKPIFDILAFASIMVLVVGGLAVIASLMGIFNLSHGEFVLLGAYTVCLFGTRGLPIWLSMLAVPIVAMLATYAIGLTIR